MRDLGRHPGAGALRSNVAAKVTGLPASKIVLHNHYLGGGFGRRLDHDSVEQAVASRNRFPTR